MDIEEFEKFVDKAISELPKKFKDAMDNVAVVVEEWPSRRQSRGHLLLGLYQGVPKTAWGRWQGQMLPDKISIFKGPIEFLGNGDLERTKELIKGTVIHEIAHHFGISDERINEINKGRAS